MIKTLAAAAGFAAVVAFGGMAYTAPPAHADYPACQSLPAGSGHDACDATCAANHMPACGVPPAGPGVGTCVGSAIDCGTRAARCAEGTGPCPN